MYIWLSLFPDIEMNNIWNLLVSAFVDFMKIILSLFAWLLFGFGLVGCVISIEDKDPAWAVSGVLIALSGILLALYLRKHKKESRKPALFRPLKSIDVECPGCGAVNRIMSGRKKACEYCGRLLAGRYTKDNYEK